MNQIRMKHIAFHHLCHILTEGEHVYPTIHMSVAEQVFIFLHIIGHNVRFRVMGSRIYRSTELFIDTSRSSLEGPEII